MTAGERAVAFQIVQRATPGDESSALVPTGTTQVWFWCPGCDEAHAVQVDGSHPGPKWTWNGSLDRPTFSPSLLTWQGDRAAPTKQCHSFINDGRIQFLHDCTHALAGQTVDIPSPPEWLRR